MWWIRGGLFASPRQLSSSCWPKKEQILLVPHWGLVDWVSWVRYWWGFFRIRFWLWIVWLRVIAEGVVWTWWREKESDGKNYLGYWILYMRIYGRKENEEIKAKKELEDNDRLPNWNSMKKINVYYSIILYFSHFNLNSRFTSIKFKIYFMGNV